MPMCSVRRAPRFVRWRLTPHGAPGSEHRAPRCASPKLGHVQVHRFTPPLIGRISNFVSFCSPALLLSSDGVLYDEGLCVFGAIEPLFQKWILQTQVPGIWVTESSIQAQPISTPGFPIRLVDGENKKEGRVEVFLSGQWGTVCDDGWTDKDAAVTCRQLGYKGPARARPMAYFGEGKGPIHVDNVRCTGTERSLADCVKQELGRHNCRHSEDAGVICDYFGKKASGNGSAGESPLGPAQAEAAGPTPRPEQTLDCGARGYPRAELRVLRSVALPAQTLQGAERRAGGLLGRHLCSRPWSRSQPFLNEPSRM
ncbi:Neurotrypsin [Pteropus alecto]|uniref:Neurotrypsin n=1 Tax=Pteropus alecto TaxID=9402 RepID=L5K8A1_PTEAL|nr:Neurotrypsin [Pteropus alecto]